MSVLNKDKILEAAKEFVAQGKPDRAIREYEKLLQADPQDMRVKMRIAELHVKRRQLPQAIQTYREVADHYASSGFYLKAVTVLKSVLRLNPSLLDINQGLADLYEKMGLNQDAAHQYEILANAFDQKGEYAQALAVREKLVNLFPEHATYRIRLAESYQREDKQNEAIEQFEILARQYKKKGVEPKKLIDLYEKILPHRPEADEMFADLVHLYFERKDFKSALRWMEQRKQRVAGDAALLALQAKMYADLNQLDTARGKYQQLAQLFEEQGEAEKALQAYGEILVFLPEEGESVKTEAERIQPGSFEKLAKQAAERRTQKIKEEEQKELEVERKKAAMEKEREEQAKAKERGKREAKSPSAPAAAVVKGQAAAKAPAAAVKGQAAVVKTPAAPVAAPGAAPGAPAAPGKSIENLLNLARTSVSLVKAYRATGLNEEASQEVAHAKKALEAILKTEPNHAEAKRLLGEIG